MPWPWVDPEGQPLLGCHNTSLEEEEEDGSRSQGIHGRDGRTNKQKSHQHLSFSKVETLFCSLLHPMYLHAWLIFPIYLDTSTSSFHRGSSNDRRLHGLPARRAARKPLQVQRSVNPLKGKVEAAFLRTPEPPRDQGPSSTPWDHLLNLAPKMSAQLLKNAPPAGEQIPEER